MPEKAIFKYVTAYAGATPERDLSNHTLLFTHVPKTGGTTLDYILRAVAMTQRIKVLRVLGTIYGQFHGVGKRETARDFARWPDTVLQQRCYVSGHLPFGIHRRLSRPYFYTTLVRDPVARLLSQYRFGVLRGGWYETSSIAEVIEKGLIAENLQTRQIAGVTDRTAPCTAQTLTDAIDHLRSEYTVVGTSERFDDTLKLLITLLGWPDVAYGNRQVTAGAPSPHLIEQAQEAVQRFFGYDLELYAVARELEKQNLPRIIGGTPTESRRQDHVLVCIPGLPVDETADPLISAKMFDELVRPGLQAGGADIEFV